MAGRGYVKLYRDVMDHPIFAHEGMLRLWCFCLLRANWKDSQWLVPGTLISMPVKRGQFITGGNSLYESLYGSEYKGDKPSVRTIWRWLEALRDMECLEMQTVSSRCTLVTICNYETYQDANDGECQADDKPVSSSCHAGVTPVTTNKETNHSIKKEGKNGKLNTHSEIDPLFESFWLEFPSGRKQGKELARKAFAAALKKTTAQTIIEAAMEYAASPVGRGEFVKGPAAWLNQGCWSDDRAAWNRSTGSQGKSLFDPDDPTGNMAVARRYLERRENGEDD
jgi:hypothetical protein